MNNAVQKMEIKPGKESEPQRSEPVAVIDVGSSSVRMAVAQVNPQGKLSFLENLSQEVSLGSDTFIKGYIERETIEKCVKALKSFTTVLAEYGVDTKRNVMAVTTSAVREASNRNAFLDRVFIATGLSVKAIDASEVSRFTFLGIKPFIERNTEINKKDLVILEVGGGNSELIYIKNGRVSHSYSYRLGSFKMRESLSHEYTSEKHIQDIMKNQIDKTAGQISKKVPQAANLNLMALGSDARFAADHLAPEWGEAGFAKLPVLSLEKFTAKINAMTIDHLVKKYKLSYPDAESVGPALLTYSTLAKKLQAGHVFVSSSTMRDGILQELVSRDPWTGSFQEQIMNSALEIGRKYEFDEAHAKYVSNICERLFDILAPEHKLQGRHRLILSVAGILHEIGLFVSNRSHHKHSMYLINNSSLFGLSAHDLMLLALVARYHRKAMPKSTHEGFAQLDRDSRIAVSKMAAIIRIADALDTNHSQRISEIEISMDKGNLVLTSENAVELSLEQMAVKRKSDLFEQVFGCSVMLRRKG